MRSEREEARKGAKDYKRVSEKTDRFSIFKFDYFVKTERFKTVVF